MWRSLDAIPMTVLWNLFTSASSPRFQSWLSAHRYLTRQVHISSWLRSVPSLSEMPRLSILRQTEQLTEERQTTSSAQQRLLPLTCHLVEQHALVVYSVACNIPPPSQAEPLALSTTHSASRATDHYLPLSVGPSSPCPAILPSSNLLRPARTRAPLRMCWS